MGTQVWASAVVKGTEHAWEGRGPFERASVRVSLAPAYTRSWRGDEHVCARRRRSPPRGVPTVLCEQTHIHTKTLRSEQSESQRCRGGRQGVRGAPGSPRTPPAAEGRQRRGGPQPLRCSASQALCKTPTFAFLHKSRLTASHHNQRSDPHPPRPLLHLFRWSQQQSEGGGWQV